MFFGSAAVLNLCVLLCDVLNHNVTEEGLNSRKTEVILPKLLEARNQFPYDIDSESCSKCNSDWVSTYISNASSYTNFLLYTRDSGDDYTEVTVGDSEALFNGGFDLSKKTKIVVHGWLSNGSNYMAEHVRTAALEAADINVITVDWGKVAESVLYNRARSGVTPVGEYTAKFVDFLVDEVGVSPDDIHLVGHSLGAHVCGVTGESVTSGQLTRITGLDPAAPGFDSTTTGRLDVSDAEFVDVIHTCIGYLGWYDALGTVDFYPNGGYPTQPGCGVDITDCSHDRSYYYYSESLSSLGFIGTRCNYWLEYKLGWCSGNAKAIMGEFVDESASGVYYLYTNSESPFAAGNSSVSLKQSKHRLHFKKNL